MHSKEQTRSRISDGTRQGARRVFAAAAVLVVLAVILLILSILQARRPASSLRQNGFLSSSGEDAVYAAAGNGLAAAGHGEIRLYSPSGKIAAEMPAELAQPMCAGGAAVSVFYDDGLAGLYALYPDGSHRSMDTDGPVVFAEVNETGLITVILSIKNTRGTVMVYDTDLTPLFRWDAGTGFPLSARVSRDDTLCVNCASGGGGMLCFFRIDREEEQARFTVPDEVILDLGFLSDGTIAAVTAQRLLLVGTDGALIAERSFEGGHLDAFSLRGETAAVAVLSGYGGGQGTLTTYDSRGQTLGSVAAARHVDALTTDGTRLLALFTGEESTLFSADLSEIVSYQPEESVDRVFLTHGGVAYFAGPEGVTQIDFGR